MSLVDLVNNNGYTFYMVSIQYFSFQTELQSGNLVIVRWTRDVRLTISELSTLLMSVGCECVNYVFLVR